MLFEVVVPIQDNPCIIVLLNINENFLTESNMNIAAMFMIAFIAKDLKQIQTFARIRSFILNCLILKHV